MQLQWITVFTAIICLNTGCKKDISAIRPEIHSITSSVYASGIVKSKQQYTVFANTSGVIGKIHVSEGDVVKNGAPLVTIHNKVAQLNAENANIAAAYSDISATRDKLLQIQKDIELAQIKVSSDSALLVRQQNIWSQGIGTRIELEQRELTYQNARTTLENLKLRWNDTQKQLKFNAAQTKKNLEISKALLSDYVVKAEISGKIYALNKEVGEMITPQTPLGTIGDDKEFILELEIDEYDITKIKPGQEVIVRLNSYPDDVYEARVRKVNPFMNNKTKMFTIEALFVNKPEVLYPNLTIEANIVLFKKDNALTVPLSYISDDKYVTLKDGSKREIKTGLRDLKRAEVTEGLNADTEIIIKQ